MYIYINHYQIQYVYIIYIDCMNAYIHTVLYPHVVAKTNVFIALSPHIPAYVRQHFAVNLGHMFLTWHMFFSNHFCRSLFLRS